jgi:hypothetical protein
VSRAGRDDSYDERVGSPPLYSPREVQSEHPFRSSQRAGSSDHGEATVNARNPDHEVPRENFPSLDESDVKTLTDIGTFRALAVEDLARQRYGGDLLSRLAPRRCRLLRARAR